MHKTWVMSHSYLYYSGEESDVFLEVPSPLSTSIEVELYSGLEAAPPRYTCLLHIYLNILFFRTRFCSLQNINYLIIYYSFFLTLSPNPPPPFYTEFKVVFFKIITITNHGGCELNKADTNRHEKVYRKEPRKPHPYTKNYRQIRNAGSGKGVLP